MQKSWGSTSLCQELGLKLPDCLSADGCSLGMRLLITWNESFLVNLSVSKHLKKRKEKNMKKMHFGYLPVYYFVYNFGQYRRSCCSD